MFPSSFRHSVVFTACFLIFGSLSAQGGELLPPGTPGPTMKTLDEIDSSITISTLPFPITLPGTYCLSSDLTGKTGTSGIEVLSDDVVIDGRGFSLRGVPDTTSGVLISGVRNNVTIKNLTVQGWGENGVSSLDSPVRCVGVRCVGNGGAGFSISHGDLDSCVATGNSASGCVVRGGGHVTVLKACDMGGNTGDGLRVSGHGHVTVLKLCSMDNNTENGMVCEQPAEVRCDDSSFSGNGSSGAVCRGGYLDKSSPMLYRGCVANNNGGNGFGFDSVKELDKASPLISRCVASSNGGNGLHVDSSFTGLESLRCEDSSFSGNGGHGVRVSCGRIDKATPLLFEACASSSNGGNGFDFTYTKELDKSTPKLYEGCSSSGNTGHGVSVELTHDNQELSMCVKDLSCEGNGESGLRVHDSSSSGGSVHVCGESSHFISNGGGGFDVQLQGNYSVSDFGLSRCVSSSNGGPGVSVDAPSTAIGGAGGAVYVDSSRCDNNAGDGFSVLASSLRCVSSSSSNNTGDGLHVSGGTGECVDAWVERCSSSSNDGAGISVSSLRCVIDRNSSSDNTVGISVSSSSSGAVSNNMCSSNTDRGITINTSHVEYSNNRCVANSSGGMDVETGSSNLLRGNYLSGNGVFGVALRTSDNRLYGSSSTDQVSPLFQADAVVNDISPKGTALSSGDANIGF